MTDDGEGIRLSKQVAAQAGCSRREAEWLIESGAVQVDGAPVCMPQARVQPHQQVHIAPGARPAPIEPVTLLLHKPAGLSMEAAVQQFLVPEHRMEAAQALPVLPRHLAGQRCVAPLDAQASGLVVFTQVPGIERRLREQALFIEHELMVGVIGIVTPEVLSRLQQQTPGRVSISRQAQNSTGLRFALKNFQPGRVMRLCEDAGLQIESMKRLRIGRLPLAGLPSGQWRYLLMHERF